MSRSNDQLKLKINKACDLNSISVLPPHSRRSNAMSQASQIRSQSQQSFSQGISFSQSQLSQTSFDENVMMDQRFGSQEKDKTSKRIPSLASDVATRDESQMKLVRTSNNAMRRWGTASVPDNRCQVNEELDHRIRQMEGLLNRLGMILDSVQNDVIQVNRSVKEISIEMEGVRQKIFHLDNSTCDVIKEDRLKAFLDANLKSISEKIMESNGNKINEIAAAISVLPKQMESHIVKFQGEVCTIVAEKIEVLTNGMKSLKSGYPVLIQSPRTKYYSADRQFQKNQIAIAMPPQSSHTRRFPVSKKEAELPKVLQPKLTGSHHLVALKNEEVPLASKEKDFRIIIDTDEESDVGLSCFLVKKETGKSSYLAEEAEEETRRILRKARKRKRRQNNCVTID